ELLLDVQTVPFCYGYNDWGTLAFEPGTDGEQKGLGGDLNFGVGFAPRPGRMTRELKASKVRQPAECIAISDNTSDGSWDYNIDPTNPREYPGKIHRNGSNVLFCDGHVAW